MADKESYQKHGVHVIMIATPLMCGQCHIIVVVTVSSSPIIIQTTEGATSIICKDFAAVTAMCEDLRKREDQLLQVN